MATKRFELTARAGGPLLVQSRLRPPVSRVPWIRRPELLRRLRDGSRGSLTVVSAPPGFGKTTLLAQWTREDARRMPFAWLTLGDDSQDPVTFLFYVIEALRSVDPTIGRNALRRLGGPGDPSSAAMGALLNDLDSLPDRTTLIVDDLDSLREPESRHWMEYLVDNLSGSLHIALAARSVPLLPLGRHRAQGDLTELAGPDLRFDEDEAAALLRRRMGVEVSDRDLGDLLAATEGWPTGIYLAGLYLSGDPARAANEFRGTHRHVADFLRDEVLNRQPEALREFMLRTSILDRLSPGLCDAVSGTDGAALMLGDLERSNLFVVPLDEDAEWYRYQLLFREMLRAELARRLPAEIPDLHRRASRWHQQHGTAGEAVRHAFAAGDVDLAVELLKANWVVQVRSGRRSTVESWLHELPYDVVERDPHLCAIAAWMHTYAGDFDVARVWLSRIPDGIPAPEQHLPDGFSTVDTIRELVLAHPTFAAAAAVRAARRALELEPPGAEWRSAAQVALGINLYLAGHMAEARTHLEAARVESTTAPRPGVQLLALTYLSLVEHDVGDPAVADELGIEARELMDVFDVVDYPLLAPMYVASAMAASRTGSRTRAEADLEEAMRLAGLYGRSLIPALTAILAAKLRLSWGDVAGCRALLREGHVSLNACQDPGALREEFAALDSRTRVRGPRQELPETLTASEVAVLRLLATDLSLGEIAARLFVSINTIKTHTRHIYQKLHTPSRHAAVERGRSLDLI